MFALSVLVDASVSVGRQNVSDHTDKGLHTFTVCVYFRDVRWCVRVCV